jgi:transposase
MARYKHYDYGQTKMLPVSYERQILPGTFEHTLNELIDRQIDLTVFESRYCNDATGAPAYDPAILLKIVLFAYSKGITSSRQIESLCRENVLFMALSADTQPHFTTIADFISGSSEQIAQVFRDVLLVCDEAGLIGKQMFAIDGVKLPSNASKEWSGTQAEYSKKIEKMERAAQKLLARHREVDAQDQDGETPAMQAARAQQIKALEAAVAKVRGFLRRHQDKVGPSGRVKKSNITDNDSAKMLSSKGVIQGYDGLAMVDAKHQIVVHAEAFGEGQEHGLLIPMLEGTRQTFRALDLSNDVLKNRIVTADAGFCSEANNRYLLESGVDAYVADPQFRRRDVRFADAAQHRPKRVSEPFAKPKKLQRFQPRDFRPAKDFSHCICPAGERLYRNGGRVRMRDQWAVKFTGSKHSCQDCALRRQCLRYPDRTAVRQVTIARGRLTDKPPTFAARMRERIDSERGRHLYGRRLAIVEPVFANIRSTRKLNRLSLRGRKKVNAQWQLYCLVHNIGKLQRYGPSSKSPDAMERRSNLCDG